jgi:GT2 family glycosyltransferase
VHRVFGLQPKVAPHTTTVTGSNGLFRRSVFDAVSFNPDKKNGEDVALGYQIAAAKLKTITVPGLLVDHRETKTYRESLAWLFESGIGASRQFYEHKQVRMPDIAFAGFAGLTLLTGLTAIFTTRFWFVPAIMLFGYTMLSSAAHMHGKFVLAATPLRSAGALLGNATLLVAYYCGRAVGFAKEWK